MPLGSDPNVVPVVSVGPPEIDIFSFLVNVYDRASDWFPSIFSGAKATFGIIVGISLPLSLFFIIAIIYCVEQLKYIRKKEELMYDTKTEPAYQETGATDPALSHRWENVIRHIESPNQNDWKQAILEADMILDDILTAMGYKGESIGEKLKRVVSGDFKSVQDAWEAHLVRNKIAHEANYNLTHYDALAAVNLYKKVFEEFYYI
jgi:hypothetical protein